MIACAVCGANVHWIGSHLSEHGMTLSTYVERHPQAEIASKDVWMMYHLGNTQKKRQHPPSPDTLTISFAGMTPKVHHDVPADDCLPLPKAYHIPTVGSLGEDVQYAAMSLMSGRSVYIWGEAGTGKDALIHAWSYMTRTPALIFQIEPGVDTRAWFFSHEFNGEGTYWNEGELLKALRDGYTSPTSGRRMPYLILITDFDRASRDQAEALRLVMDSIEGRVKGPNGVTYKVYPGTQIVVTANSAGGGDERGRYVSSNVIDASILDRFERVYQFHLMSWEDEEKIVREKFPYLVEKSEHVFAMMGKASAALRTAIANEELYGEFSHRGLCSWLGAAEDWVRLKGDHPSVLRFTFRAWCDKLPDSAARMAADKVVDPHLR